MQVILSVVVLCFTLVIWTSHEANGKDVMIFREENDIFTNIFRCKESNAVCFDESCAYCQCMVDQTFIRTRGQYGKCISNNLIVYATSHEASFLMQCNYAGRQICIYQKPYDTDTFVLGSTTCSYVYWNSLWIWTNFGQLLNWQTLECMTDDFVSIHRQHFPTMKKCDRNNQKQLWKCVHDKKHKIKQTQSGRYLYYGENGAFVTTKKVHQYYATIWTRFGSDKEVCSQAVGCDTFADDSSFVILNKTKCEEESECLGEKEINLSKTRCSLLPNKTLYLHNDTWKTLEMKNGSLTITVDKVFLQWNLRKTPKSWGGLMVKVQFKCEEMSGTINGQTEHCVVIKYTGTFKGFHSDGDDDNGGEDGDGDTDNGGEDGDGDTDNGGDTTDGDTDNDGDNDGDTDGDTDTDGGGDNTNKGKTDRDQESSGGEKDNTQTIIIIVCVLVALLLTGVIAFIIYKYRNRLVRSGKRTIERQDLPPKEEYSETMNPLYPANNKLSGQRECELYESTPDHVYQYVDADRKTAGPPSPNPTYDYAVVDSPLTKSKRSNVDIDSIGGKGTPGGDEGLKHDREEKIGETKDKTQSTKPPPHKYHVLEGP